MIIPRWGSSQVSALTTLIAVYPDSARPGRPLKQRHHHRQLSTQAGRRSSPQQNPTGVPDTVPLAAVKSDCRVVEERFRRGSVNLQQQYPVHRLTSQLTAPQRCGLPHTASPFFFPITGPHPGSH
jgi:hypothetical protein